MIYLNFNIKHYLISAYFCSEVCRKKALETYHNKSESTDCCFKTRMAQIMMENAIKAFDGCRCKLKELFCDNKLYPKTIFDFELNNDDEIENQKSHLLAMFSLIEGVNFGDKNIDEVDHYFVDCALAIAKKCCHLTSAQNIRGIFLLGSLFNHSCAPNVMVFQFGQVNVYTVIRPIIEGEQLFISYG